MTELVHYTLADGIATLTLANGKVNAISPQLLNDFNTCLDRAEADAAVVVITASGTVLSGGFDLTVMKAGGAAAVELVANGFALSRRLLNHPYPVVVSTPGHAVAMGAFLLLSADYRLGADGAFNIGLNEVKIGMTMPYTGIELARDRLNPPFFQRSVVNAELFSPQAAVVAGFLDKVVSADTLPAATLEVAIGFKQLNMQAHKNTKLKLREKFFAAFDAAVAADSGVAL